MIFVLRFEIYFISLILHSRFVLGDPCTTYQELGTAEDSSRSAANSYINNDICDAQLTEGWYRILSKAGERMPTECILGGFRCGAQNPIWMDGTFPDTGDIKNVTAYATNPYECKADSFDIQVKNCSSFIVYNLKPVSDCSQRYCFGSELPCPSGQTSDNGFSPGCKYDPCLSVNYKELNEWKRSTGNTDVSGLCDNFLTSGWYRPTSLVGNTMPTECQVNGFKCGTTNPIWMNGSHPSVRQTIDVTACVSEYNGDCCGHSYNIQVKNCDGYYVYNLTHTNGCYQAYCFGNESKCPVGETSDNGGFTPGCEFDPCHESNYEILHGEIKRSSNYTLQSDDVAIEDSRLSTGWYKIVSLTGNDIVNESVSMSQCGTVFPLWMQGSIPSMEEKTIDRKVCRSDQDGYCSVKYDIKVRNCGNYRTYFLNQLNVDKTAYCFGTLPVPPPTTTTTTTTEKPDNGESKNDKEKSKSSTMIIILVLSLLIAFTLIGFAVIGCYKVKTKEKRCVSFVDFVSPLPKHDKNSPYILTMGSQPPSYDDVIRQNDENTKRAGENGNTDVPGIINTPNLTSSLPPVSTRPTAPEVEHNYR